MKGIYQKGGHILIATNQPSVNQDRAPFLNTLKLWISMLKVPKSDNYGESRDNKQVTLWGIQICCSQC